MTRAGAWLLVGWMVMAPAVMAQATSEADDKAYRARQTAEKTRITAERQRLASSFAAEQAACQHRFAVNDCVDKSRRAQRDALADLRRQEVLLTDEDRRRKAGARLDKLEDKGAEHARDAASRPTAAPRHADKPPPRPASGRLPASTEKAPPVRDLAREGEHEDAMQRKRDQHTQEAARRAERAALAEEQERRFDEKQRKAAEYRARVLDRGTAKPSTGKPLPAPGS